MAEIGSDINKAKLLLEAGELVAIPTETVYGLAGNALDVNAITKIFSVKNRPTFDPLIVHTSSMEKANHLVMHIPDQAVTLAEKFWPGPLTLVLSKQSHIPDLVTSGLDTVGIRCPDHSLTRELLNLLDFPLAAPSANPFGYVSPTKPEHVNDQLGDKIAYILDGGVCRVGIESTIVGFENNIPHIYRFGGLTQEAIQAVIGEVNVRTHSSSNPLAPGQLENHYSPSKKMILGNLKTLVTQYSLETSAVLSFQTDFNCLYQFILSPSGSTEEAAQQLFTALRHLDTLPIDCILAEEVPSEGLGRAINDRLKRAAALRY